MTDLRTLMHDAVADGGSPLPDAAADIARGRLALRRRRHRRIGVTAGLAVVAVLGAVAIGARPGTNDDTSASTTSRSAVALVAYTGAQPAGYELDKVPAGWEVRDSTSTVLTLAPTGSAPSSTEPGGTSMVGTIAVMTEQGYRVPSGVPSQDVEVDGRPGAIIDNEGPGDTRTLYVEQSSGDALVVQVWDGLGWDAERIVDFAESVRVTDQAAPGVG